MKNPTTYHPRAPEPQFSHPAYTPDFGPPINDLEFKDRLRDPTPFLFTAQAGEVEPKTLTIVAQAPTNLVDYFVLSIPPQAKTTRCFDVTGFSVDAVKLAVAWMMSGGHVPLSSLTPNDMPTDIRARLVRQVLDLADKLRILALSWKAGEFLDGVNMGKGLGDRVFRGEISKGFEGRWMRNKGEYVRRIEERDRDTREEVGTEMGVWGCLGGCLGVLVCLD